MTVSSLVCAPRSAGASRAKASRTIEASVMPRFIAPSSEEWRSSYPRVGIASNPAATCQRGRLSEEELAGLEPGLGGERQRFHVDALVVAVEPAGHRLGRQGAREEAEPVGDRAVIAEVRRVGEPDDHAWQEPRAR